MARQSFFTRSQIVAIPIPWKIWKGIGERSTFFRMVLQKLAFSGKRGRFKAKSHEIKVVGNAILKAVYSIIFFLGCIL